MDQVIEYLTVDEVLHFLVEKGTLTRSVAETLRVPYWQKDGPLDDNGPTPLFKELVQSAGYTLRYTYSDDRERNLYWLM